VNEMDKIIPIQAVFDAFANWDGLFIRGGDYSVTDLLNSPRVVHLLKRHSHELPPQTVEELFHSFQGSSWHSFLDRYLRRAMNKPKWKDRFLSEAKFWDKFSGRKVAGKIDVYDNKTKTLYDYKVTSVYKVMFGGDGYEDYHTQLNAYAWFLGNNGFEVKKARIICIHPDWGKYKMMADKMYPRQRIHQIKISVWDRDTQEKMIKDAVIALKGCEDLPDGFLPHCTDKDMWVRPGTYALMEPGKDRATRVLPDRSGLESYIQHRQETKKPLKPGYEIIYRESERTRCESFCRVKSFCNQYAEYKEKMSGVRG
jgi:hypothetical protein